MSSFAYVRDLDAATRAAVVELSTVAFAVGAARAERWLEQVGKGDIRAVRLGGTVAGALILIPMGQMFGGRSVPMVGLAGVSVAMGQRRRGVASRMLAATLGEAHERGFALSTLYASNQPLYRRAGYETAGSRFTARVNPSAIDVDGNAGRLRSASHADQALVARTYRDAAKRYPGFLDRGPYIWPRVVAEHRGERTHGLLLLDEARSDDTRDDDEQLAAYVYFRLRQDGEWQALDISDAMARDADGWRRVWCAVRDVSTMVRSISFCSAPSDPLYAALGHPRVQMQLHENWMLRVVDVTAALEARGYSPAVSAELTFAVRDDVLAHNDATFRLSVSEGVASCTPTDAPAQLNIDVRGLAALYSGFASPALLRQRALLLLDGDARHDATLAALFAGPAPWMREMF